MGNSHAPGLFRVFEMMVAAADVYQHPSVFLEPGNDFSAIHRYIIHIIHTSSTPMLAERLKRHQRIVHTGYGSVGSTSAMMYSAYLAMMTSTCLSSASSSMAGGLFTSYVWFGGYSFNRTHGTPPATAALTMSMA